MSAKAFTNDEGSLVAVVTDDDDYKDVMVARRKGAKVLFFSVCTEEEWEYDEFKEFKDFINSIEV